MPKVSKWRALRSREENAMKTCLLGVAALLVAQTALAHHSFAPFELTKNLTLVGTIKEVQFTNPHVWLQVLVPDGKGGQKEWSIEAGAPGMLLRTGWKPTTLKPGDAVTVVTHPAKNGGPTGSLVQVTTASGQTLGPGGAATPLKSEH
jgi:Family of unknown function (DUF6152)